MNSVPIVNETLYTRIILPRNISPVPSPSQSLPDYRSPRHRTLS